MRRPMTPPPYVADGRFPQRAREEHQAALDAHELLQSSRPMETSRRVIVGTDAMRHIRQQSGPAALTLSTSSACSWVSADALAGRALAAAVVAASLKMGALAEPSGPVGAPASAGSAGSRGAWCASTAAWICSRAGTKSLAGRAYSRTAPAHIQSVSEKALPSVCRPISSANVRGGLPKRACAQADAQCTVAALLKVAVHSRDHQRTHVGDQRGQLVPDQPWGACPPPATPQTMFRG